jgi:glutamine amidotransferase
MKRSVSILDYGASNLHNVARAVEAVGHSVSFVSSPEALNSVDRLILPGVGAFGEGMRHLTEGGFVEAIREFADSGKPLLGICLGMQMLFDSSEESDKFPGLSIIDGIVRRIPANSETPSRKIPHIGWTSLKRTSADCWKNSPLRNVDESECVYFVHSYAVQSGVTDTEIGTTEYDGFRFASFVRSGQVYGCQFHPEKSGPVGLKIIESFISM